MICRNTKSGIGLLCSAHLLFYDWHYKSCHIPPPPPKKWSPGAMAVEKESQFEISWVSLVILFLWFFTPVVNHEGMIQLVWYGLLIISFLKCKGNRLHTLLILQVSLINIFDWCNYSSVGCLKHVQCHSHTLKSQEVRLFVQCNLDLMNLFMMKYSV